MRFKNSNKHMQGSGFDCDSGGKSIIIILLTVSKSINPAMYFHYFHLAKMCSLCRGEVVNADFL